MVIATHRLTKFAAAPSSAAFKPAICPPAHGVSNVLDDDDRIVHDQTDLKSNNRPTRVRHCEGETEDSAIMKTAATSEMGMATSGTRTKRNEPRTVLDDKWATITDVLVSVFSNFLDRRQSM